MTFGKLKSSKVWHIFKDMTLCGQISFKDKRIITKFIPGFSEFEEKPLCHNCRYIYNHCYERHF